ncbi:MAG: glycine--tRNA ligase subunit beta, partial [Pseudomonadota bacterium]
FAQQRVPEWWLKQAANIGLEYKEFKIYATPRRLTLVLNNISSNLSAEIEKRGPRVGAPEQAINAFAKSCGVLKNQLSQEATTKGEFYFFREQATIKSVAEQVAELINKFLHQFSWPKTMRWEATGVRWIRPVRSILAVADNETIANIKYAGLTGVNFTYGHRSLGNDKKISVSNFDQYQSQLASQMVMLNQNQRQDVIKNGLTAIASNNNYSVDIDSNLVVETAGLVEQPYVMVGTIDAQFMQLPPEILTVCMKSHQRYFATYCNGKLNANFAFVANHNLAPEIIIKGNEKVLRARLEDAQFYWQQDLQTTPQQALTRLSSITYQAELGSINAKCQRLQQLAIKIDFGSLEVSVDDLTMAAKYAKIDLGLKTVGEFPEVQGIIASHYLKHHNFADSVCSAIANHYLPQGANDKLPQSPLGLVLAILDKLDHMVGFFAIGKGPTGSKDPFAIRRSCLGLIKLLLALENDLNFDKLLKIATQNYNLANTNDLQPELVNFVRERLKVWWQSQGYRHDLIAAILSGKPPLELQNLTQKLKTLTNFVSSHELQPIIQTAKRVNNILPNTEYITAKPNISLGGPEHSLLQTISSATTTLTPNNHNLT